MQDPRAGDKGAVHEVLCQEVRHGRARLHVQILEDLCAGVLAKLELKWPVEVADHLCVVKVLAVRVSHLRRSQRRGRSVKKSPRGGEAVRSIPPVSVHDEWRKAGGMAGGSIPDSRGVAAPSVRVATSDAWHTDEDARRCLGSCDAWRHKGG